jgi:exodeoxyribonuclease VII large subunit
MICAVSQQLEAKQNQTNQAMHLLDTVSPLKTLGRGYSIIRDDQNAVVRSISQVKAGDQLRGQLVDGELVLAVTGSSDKKL